MKSAPLGVLADFVRGITFKPTDVTADGVGVMRTKNVQGTLDLADVMRVPAALVRRQAQYLQPGDTLVSSANSWYAVGKACWVPELAEPLAIGGFVTALRPVSPEIDARYLYRWFTAPRTQATLRSFANKTTNISNLNLKRTAELGVPLPQLSEQRRIAAILDHADALRAKRRQVLGQLEVLTQSVFDDMFGEELPTAPLGELAETRLGKMLDAKKQTGEHRRPYLRNANVQWFRFELGDLLEMDFNEKDRITLALQEGDVLVCEGGQPGRSAVWRGELDECYFQKALHRVRLGDELEPEYFARAMKKIVDSNGLKDYVTSSTIAHLTGEKFRTLPIPVPPRERQREFTERIARINTQITCERRALAAGDALFVSLQSRAFRGEL